MQDFWVSFDCFGTLVDWNSGFLRILQPIAGERTPTLLREYHRFERLIEAEQPHLSYRNVLAKSLTRAAATIDMNLPGQAAHLLSEHWASLSVFPDIEDALAGLRAAGCKLAVLTNCDNDLFAETQRTFRSPFDIVITAEQVRSYKPSLTHF